MNNSRAIGKTDAKSLNLFNIYRLPIESEDLGQYNAILDYKSWGEHICLWCFFTLDNGQKIRLHLYKNKNGLFTPKNGDYDFSIIGNLGQYFQINISANSKGNAFLESGIPCSNIKAPESHLSDINFIKPKIIVKNMLYYSKINDMEELEKGFFEACKKGDLSLVKYLLLEKSVNINTSDFNGGSSGLRLACSEGHLPIVRFLLKSTKLKEHTDYIQSDNWSKFPGLRVACNNEHFHIVNFLLKKNFKPEEIHFLKLLKKLKKSKSKKLFKKFLNLYKKYF